MALENKLGITESTELAKAEERISKTKALEMFQQGLLDTFEVGTFRGLSQIHKYLFDEIYDVAGQVRTEVQRPLSFLHPQTPGLR